MLTSAVNIAVREESGSSWAGVIAMTDPAPR